MPLSRSIAKLFALMTTSQPAYMLTNIPDFVPGKSVTLDPVTSNGFFTSNDSVLVSIDRSTWGDHNVTIDALGSITIHGTIDVGLGPPALTTGIQRGSITRRHAGRRFTAVKTNAT